LWDEAKNIAALEKIAPQLSWPVYVAGDTRQPGKSGQAKPPAPTASGFHLLGKLDSAAMAAWMSRAAVYALPAFYEPFGLSILEAASAGCALVLGDIPSLRENWDGAAAFVPPGDSGALAKALRRLIDSAEERIDLAARARRRSLGFTAGMMTGAYLASYAQIRHAAACPAP
ncbi:MAG: glycosyltransferase family 4 protein, partial [Acidobacteriia bacterium]|nr:glycosyltransferase family 4 protein [Terriglobia bacterium]